MTNKDQQYLVKNGYVASYLLLFELPNSFVFVCPNKVQAIFYESYFHSAITAVELIIKEIYILLIAINSTRVSTVRITYLFYYTMKLHSNNEKG